MICFAIIVCVVVCLNAGFAAVGLAAAARYGICTTFARGAGLLVLTGGTATEFAALALHSYHTATGLFMLGFSAVTVGAACDAASGYVFDVITLPCLGLMFAYAAITHSVAPVVAGATIAGGSLAVLYALTRGRGLGLGDVKLACCIGGAAGVIGGMESLGIAFVLGGAYAGYLLLTKRGQRGDELRFAPYMATGMALAVLFGTGA